MDTTTRIKHPNDIVKDNRQRRRQIQNLENKILTLAANINAAKYEWLALLAEFDRIEGFSECDDAGSTANWLSFKCGITPGAARENVRVARKLTGLPKISAEFKSGRLSYSKVRAMTRGATSENEDYFIMIARHGTGAHMEKLVRLQTRTMRLMDPDLSQRVYESRSFNWREDEDGSVRISARLTADQAGAVVSVIQRISQDLRQESATEVEINVEQNRTQRYADALERLAQFWLVEQKQEKTSAVQNPATVDSHSNHKSHTSRKSHEPHSTRRPRLTAADTQTMVVHVDIATLSESELSQCSCGIENHREASNQSADQPQLRPLPGVSAATLSRIGCDASLIASIDDANGNPMNVGRRRRTISTPLHRALHARDAGCTFPGCSHDQFVDAHHIQHWCNGGETRLDNLILLCRRHHRLLHEGGYSVTMTKSHPPVFYSPKGNPISVPEADTGGVSRTESLASLNKRNGIHVSTTTVQTLWDGVRPDWSTMVEGTLATD